MTTESGQITRNSKVSHKRKSRPPLREWRTIHQLNVDDGIDEYRANDRSEYCSNVFVVVPVGEKSSTIITKDTEHEKALISKSEYDITMPDSGIFDRDAIGSYLYNIQSKKCSEDKDRTTRTADSRKNGRTGILQKRHVFRQTNRDFSAATTVENTDLASKNSQEEPLVYQSLGDKPRPKPRFGGKHKQKYHNHSLVTCSLGDSDVLVTCPSHVYTFSRGLVPSREANSLELYHNQHFLPPVIVDRVGDISQQKHYRLPRDGRSLNNVNESLFLSSYSNEQSFVPKTESKPVVYKEFSAEKVIPAAYGNKRYFDFQGYMEFLYKEKRIRKTSARARRVVYDWEKLESSAWLNNLGDVLVKDVIDYNSVLDIKGSRMKLDENRVQMRSCQTKPLQSDNRQHCFLGTPSTIYVSSKKTLKLSQPRSKKMKEKTVLIERLPSKFQFTLPGRPPSSDDSGFAE
ncbi:uncharacterized protein LOC114526388 [Dendronephthya gigantea]|uniref:uncharacterized protein LOC114526388 n=1 Tax=Dendronephthya gigantea TaxID=151771 RepID=UPI001069C126|nr:uncharacterized protein LOC114526388 [Dendronephthya gigantea]XP_028403777.1 uncharacterized protein LOC114526388 [Dendronephthya gigantea]